MRSFLRFFAKVATAHVLTYLAVGAAAYLVLTKQLYVGDRAVFASFMRTEADPELWSHVMRWFIPAQVLRAAVIAAALYPFLPALRSWGFARRLVAIAGVYIGIGFWAATVASPGTIEGLVYLRPEITPLIHLQVQAEIVVQGLLLAGWLSLWIAPIATTATAATSEAVASPDSTDSPQS